MLSMNKLQINNQANKGCEKKCWAAKPVSNTVMSTATNKHMQWEHDLWDGQSHMPRACFQMKLSLGKVSE